MPGKCVRGAVIEVNLDPVVGSEANKIRPCVVIQNDVSNRSRLSSSWPRLLAPKTFRGSTPRTSESQKAREASRRTASFNATRILSADSKRLIRTLGQLRPAIVAKVDQALRISLAL